MSEPALTPGTDSPEGFEQLRMRIEHLEQGDYVRGRVAFWRTALKLDQWTLSVHLGYDEEDRVAMIDPAESYDRAHLHINLEAIADDPNIDLDHIIVHELLHLVFRDLDAAYAKVQDYLAPDVWRLHEAHMEHEVEGIVDRLAAVISKI